MRYQGKVKYFYTVAFTGLLVSSGGCGGDFSYKRGAGVADLDENRERCVKLDRPDSEVRKCLRDSGWIIVSANETQSSRQPSVTREPAKKEALAHGASAESVSKRSLDTIAIGSWWKVGAAPDQLLADGDRCAQTLGAAHKPEANLNVVTFGLLDCMQGKGWVALKASTATPLM